MFGTVLVGVDGRPGGRDAIALAKQLMEPGAEITLARVHGGNLLFSSGAALALALAAGSKASEQLLTRERADASVDAVLATYAASSVGRGLHELAERQRADLHVVGSRHRGTFGRVLPGDGARAALNGTRCAIAIAPSGYAEMPHWPAAGDEPAHRSVAKHGPYMKTEAPV